ncbi:major sperm protein [Anaeramoeba flamelloides]|uniref:Major sperm protein n=1 Tax=Anaeramoeba flamelloides TaxID=1746091 RepID=A0ABQ8X6U3_9EUKA|nr:major sperm protein [Anaeramoeba flamelloides]
MKRQMFYILDTLGEDKKDLMIPNFLIEATINNYLNSIEVFLLKNLLYLSNCNLSMSFNLVTNSGYQDLFTSKNPTIDLKLFINKKKEIFMHQKNNQDFNISLTKKEIQNRRIEILNSFLTSNNIGNMKINYFLMNHLNHTSKIEQILDQLDKKIQQVFFIKINSIQIIGINNVLFDSTSLISFNKISKQKKVDQIKIRKDHAIEKEEVKDQKNINEIDYENEKEEKEERGNEEEVKVEEEEKEKEKKDQNFYLSLDTDENENIRDTENGKISVINKLTKIGIFFSNFKNIKLELMVNNEFEFLVSLLKSVENYITKTIKIQFFQDEEIKLELIGRLYCEFKKFPKIRIVKACICCLKPVIKSRINNQKIYFCKYSGKRLAKDQLIKTFNFFKKNDNKQLNEKEINTFGFYIKDKRKTKNNRRVQKNVQKNILVFKILHKIKRNLINMRFLSGTSKIILPEMNTSQHLNKKIIKQNCQQFQLLLDYLYQNQQILILSLNKLKFDYETIQYYALSPDQNTSCFLFQKVSSLENLITNPNFVYTKIKIPNEILIKNNTIFKQIPCKDSFNPLHYKSHINTLLKTIITQKNNYNPQPLKKLQKKPRNNQINKPQETIVKKDQKIISYNRKKKIKHKRNNKIKGGKFRRLNLSRIKSFVTIPDVNNKPIKTQGDKRKRKRKRKRK